MIRLPYIIDVQLRWSDTDAYGHVNNVSFLRLLEDARVMGLHAWMGEQRSLLESGIIVAHQEIEYLKPLEFRIAPVRVDMWCSRIGGSNFDLCYTIRDPEPVGETVYAIAETTMVLYDFEESSVRRVTDDERDVLARHSGLPVAFRRRRESH